MQLFLRYLLIKQKRQKGFQTITEYYNKKQIQGVQKRPLRHRFAPWVGKIPWRSAWQPTPIPLLRKSHRQTSLTGNSPWGCKETVFKTFWRGKDDLCFLQNE